MTHYTHLYGFIGLTLQQQQYDSHQNKGNVKKYPKFKFKF